MTRLDVDLVRAYGNFLMGSIKESSGKPLTSRTRDKSHNLYGRMVVYHIYHTHFHGIFTGREVARIEVSNGSYLGGFNRVRVFDKSIADDVRQSVSQLNQEYGLSLKVVNSV